MLFLEHIYVERQMNTNFLSVKFRSAFSICHHQIVYLKIKLIIWKIQTIKTTNKYAEKNCIQTRQSVNYPGDIYFL